MYFVVLFRPPNRNLIIQDPDFHQDDNKIQKFLYLSFVLLFQSPSRNLYCHSCGSRNLVIHTPPQPSPKLGEGEIQRS